MVAAKARLRMERPAPDYPPMDFERPVERIIHENLLTGQRAELLLYPSPRRRNQDRVTVNGAEWKRAVGRSAIAQGIRKAMWRHWLNA